MKNLTSAQIRFLRAQAHHLKPVVMVGDKGLTENVLAEVEQALEVHELIKVGVAAEREEREEAAQIMSAESGAHVVQIIGKMVVLYRPARKPKLLLPGGG